MAVNDVAPSGHPNEDQPNEARETTPAQVRRFSGRFSVRLLLAMLATALFAGPFLLLLLLMLGKWHGLSRADGAVLGWAHRAAVGHHTLTQWMIIVSAVLHPWVLRILASAAGLGCIARRRRRVGLWVLAAAWGSGLIDITAKLAVARVRPKLLDPVASAPGYSFPSGHALGSLVCLGVMAASLGPLLPGLARRCLWAVCGVLVLLIGFARVELGVHYPSDVIAGWLLGMAWLAASAAAFDVWKPAPPPLPADDSLRVDSH